jgi:hypothetical protein
MNMQIRKELDFILNNQVDKEFNYTINMLQESELIRQKYDHDKNRLELLLSILSTDGYLHKKDTQGNGWLYQPTPSGRRFISLSGYVQEGKQARRKGVWEIIKVIAAIVNAGAVIYLTYLSIVINK